MIISEQCRGLPWEQQAAWAEAILGTGYQGQELGTGAEAARKSVPFPPSSFCTLLTASSHLPSFLPPSPKLSSGGALTKVELTKDAGEEGQEVRIISY
jgi:hypothetical protein